MALLQAGLRPPELDMSLTEPTGKRPPCRVFTVAPGARFLDILVRAVLDGTLGEDSSPAPCPFTLPDTTILLPTPRAARALQSAFLNAAGSGGAMLLPQLRPIAQGDEEASLIAGLAGNGLDVGSIDVPPAVSELERRLVLMQLVQRWSASLAEAGGEDGARRGFSVTPAQAAQLASELARLIDMVETEGASLDRLKDIVPDAYATHWQQTLDFLEIIVAWWPQHLAAGGVLSPADRRNRVILAEAARLSAAAPNGPVIVAGVTGSIPATAQLMQAVAGLANGSIVLPGVDRSLSPEDCAAIVEGHPEHPQRGLLRLLGALGVAPGDVHVLPGGTPSEERVHRNRIVIEAMRPAVSTDQWQSLPERFDQGNAEAAFANVSMLAAPSAQDEAEAVALILRQAAEQPGKTAALVSPDRLLARRVAIRLESWGIRVDDSAGRPFVKTVPGAFLELVLTAVAKSFEPKALMALLKHPLARLGRSAFDMRRSARALEIAALRAPYLGHGLDGIEAALENASRDAGGGRRVHRAVQRLWEDDWAAARKLIVDLRTAFQPLAELYGQGAPQPFATFAAAHVAVAEALSALPDPDAPRELWRDEAGEVGARLFTGLRDPSLPVIELAPADYPDLYRSLVASEAVRPRVPTHPRIFIWGPFEARLQQTDVVVLGSLNDGTWPEAADPGPWLNRPMRQELGLPAPEEQIGYAAHDFLQLFGAETVYLTRAKVVDGTPTVPSRWLLRLQAVLARLACEEALAPAEPWLEWARERDAGRDLERAARPKPCPPLALRPRKLSVSSIETWIANPYALFAGRILGLDPLPPLGGDPDAALRGGIIHEALGRFTARFPAALPEDVEVKLIEIAETIFHDLRSHPRVAAFWMERFHRFARWFGQNECQLRGGAGITMGEISGACVLDAPGGPFTLTARADRLDVTAEGLVITDYKTGANLADLVSRAKDGRAPQLLLEALIAREAGFGGVPAGCDVAGLRYISASGGEPAGAVAVLKLDDLAEAIAKTERALLDLVALYDHADTPYAATRRARFRYDYDDYAHLARVAEWGGEAGEGDA
jgi:ATP-dependent helicase/nuclease subunit B